MMSLQMKSLRMQSVTRSVCRPRRSVLGVTCSMSVQQTGAYSSPPSPAPSSLLPAYAPAPAPAAAAPSEMGLGCYGICAVHLKRFRLSALVSRHTIIRETSRHAGKTLSSVRICIADAFTPLARANSGVLSPPLAYDFLASMGAAKGKYSFTKTMFMGILAGIYIGFGALLAISVCGNIPGEQR